MDGPGKPKRQHSRGDGWSSPWAGPGKGDNRVAIAFVDKVLYGRPLWVVWRGWFVDARAALHPRATIKAHPTTPYRPRPYGIVGSLEAKFDVFEIRDVDWCISDQRVCRQQQSRDADGIL